MDTLIIQLKSLSHETIVTNRNPLSIKRLKTENELELRTLSTKKRFRKKETQREQEEGDVL